MFNEGRQKLHNKSIETEEKWFIFLKKKVNVRNYQLVKYEYTMPVLIIVMLLILIMLNERTPFF